MMSMIFMMLFFILMNLFNYYYKMKFIQNLMFFMIFLFLIKFNLNNFYWMNMYYFISMDMYSYMLNLLILMILSLMFLSTNKIFNKNFFNLNLILLMFFLFMSFSSMNYFYFYLFFECSMIPTFLLIMCWGYQPERIKASLYMIMYMMFASLPKLLMIFFLMKYFFSMNYLIMLNKYLMMNFNNFMIYLLMQLIYLIKLPIFYFHLWLPKAHVEAPISGSMILASIMLKLGSYGIIRSNLMMLNLSNYYNKYLMILMMFSSLILSMICLIQNDLKMLVAYSSIIHMSMMLMSLLTLSNLGYKGGYLMMLGHGLCSPGMFCLVNFNYLRLKSRSFLINKGMIMMMPNMSMWWFFLCISNMSAPPSINLLSEMLMSISLIKWNLLIMLNLMMIMFLSSIYSMYLYSKTQHGNFKNFKNYNNYMNEYILIMLHWIPLNFLIMNSNMLI
uniref:NADH-ubiquinone oxidoreductase chain 4 n=1 Tax=Trichopria drosophilae TaxID=1507179 RepID=A0A6M3HRZ0_9HYME|nr:NADH dehydrogenase subunit 4 [Trichopria drosophilae]QIV21181.1 NADH dehydrogenase subunit 4 [Trichopria drosophilae]